MRVQGDDDPAPIVAVDFVVLPEDRGGVAGSEGDAAQGFYVSDAECGVSPGWSSFWVIESRECGTHENRWTAFAGIQVGFKNYEATGLRVSGG